MSSYIPATRREETEMLSAIGCEKIDDLFDDIPESVKIKELNLPNGMSELEVRKEIERIAHKNKVFSSIFRGAGAYCHYIPAIVKSVVSKEEFLTTYTPYQAEISQGILQSIFEYQTMICSLTGMDVSNASVYDGATAAGEAVAMCANKRRIKAFVSSTVNPQTMETVKTYCFGHNLQLVVIPEKDGVTDLKAAEEMMAEQTACLLVQQPNFYGLIEDAGALGETVHTAGGKYIMAVNPISLGILKTPREYGADIAVGEGQPLGMPVGFGGPYLGFMASVSAMMRKLPGRMVGETTDIDGKRAYVLTLQAREQHIRREKASSNICSNEALCALTAAVYMAAMGTRGIRQAAEQSMSKAQYMAKQLAKIGYPLVYRHEFFNEFVTGSKAPVEKVLSKLEENKILGGYPLGGDKEGMILWCCTEMNTKVEIDHVIEILKGV